jgi:hypothetical protein
MIDDGSILLFKGDNNESPGTNKRMGIVWRAVEMCVAKGSSQDQEQVIHAMMRGYAKINGVSDDKEADDDGGKRKKRSRAKGHSAQECVPLLLGFQPSSGDQADTGSEFRLVLDASGARALHHILYFSDKLRSDWAKGFVRVYEQGDLVRIANDGLGSRW